MAVFFPSTSTDFSRQPIHPPWISWNRVTDEESRCAFWSTETNPEKLGLSMHPYPRSAQINLMSVMVGISKRKRPTFRKGTIFLHPKSQSFIVVQWFVWTCCLVLSYYFLNGCSSWCSLQPLTGRREETPADGASLTRAVLFLLLQVSFFLFIIFVVYTMLPFNMRDAIIASVLTSSSHTIVLSVCLSATPGIKEHLVWQVGALCRRRVTSPSCWGVLEAPVLTQGVTRSRSSSGLWCWLIIAGGQPCPTFIGGIKSLYNLQQWTL